MESVDRNGKGLRDSKSDGMSLSVWRAWIEMIVHSEVGRM